ncbi:cysteine rich repeat-containing protein [Ancylobacter oerskovii]|uniref:Cysteine rich repeat-containing protein n=1 Tax=Ancylobacter oerskovii TaxID=459519 RepID=A0ABW4Z3K0_9HYPH|nr:cysteine rich repeat-containing protein [Ancylobacter oerskovii]MBS7546131.1 cysteine rich repeat-containing protein [Ancylobacter oerskovii]
MRMILIALALAATAGTALAQEGDLAKYCKSDIERLCTGVQPGGGRLLKCLKAHGKEMSVGCAQALQKMKG